MRAFTLLMAAILAACGPAPVAPLPPPPDPTTESWYGETVAELAALNREAEASFRKGKSDAAADLIKKAEPLGSRLLSVRNPTLGAAEAASDLDQLYGQMLLSNRHYEWARLQFQKNLARWRHWRPRTAETAKRLKEAESAIAECDRKMSE